MSSSEAFRERLRDYVARSHQTPHCMTCGLCEDMRAYVPFTCTRRDGCAAQHQQCRRCAFAARSECVSPLCAGRARDARQHRLYATSAAIGTVLRLVEADDQDRACMTCGESNPARCHWWAFRCARDGGCHQWYTQCFRCKDAARAGCTTPSCAELSRLLATGAVLPL